jgi:hypothetical protein
LLIYCCTRIVTADVCHFCCCILSDNTIRDFFDRGPGLDPGCCFDIADWLLVLIEAVLIEAALDAREFNVVLQQQ